MAVRPSALKRWMHDTAGLLRGVARDTLRTMREVQLPQTASSLAYTTILSIIPLLAVSFSIFQAFGGMEHLYERIEPFILANLAEGTSDEAMDAIRRFVDNAHAGAVGLGGLIGLLFTSMSMLASVEKAINRIWRSPASRHWFHRLAIYWLLITLGPLAMAIALGAATSRHFPLHELLPGGTGIFLITSLGFFCLYKFVPNRPVHWSPAAISAVFTATLWNLARLGYTVYTRRAVSYNQIYGSLGAIPILLLWIYIVWLIVLSGAALTASLQKRSDLP